LSETEHESDEGREARLRLFREARQRLEALRRAGLTTLPRVNLISPAPARPVPPSHPEPTPAEPPRIERPRDTDSSPLKPAPRPSLSAGSLFEEPTIASSPVPAADRPRLLKDLAEEVAGCTRCPHLAATRTQTVFADGSPTARLMFIGEAPGADEDRQGIPFVGRAGQLLTDMITKGMGLDRRDVYIANILKCRPPENRDPTPEESANCIGYLERQIEIVRPEFLCLLGRIAVQRILETSMSMSRMRGRWYRYRGIPTIVTFHPAYLLRNPDAKKDSWQDLQMLMNAMGLAIPRRR
jgi:DNA polymerase